jgi:hypothetical protein
MSTYQFSFEEILVGLEGWEKENVLGVVGGNVQTQFLGGLDSETLSFLIWLYLLGKDGVYYKIHRR